MLKDRPIDETIKTELIRSLEECKSLYPRIHVKDEIPTEILKQVNKRIKEVEQFFLLEGPHPSPKKNNDYVQELIKEYSLPDNNKETKFKIVVKIGKMLEQKDPKHAIILFFHLERNEDVVRLLNGICESKDC